MRFQRQLDPVYGIMEWSDFMDGVEVLTFVPAEPRKEVPGAWFSGAVAGADRTVFWEVQAGSTRGRICRSRTSRS